MRKITNIIIRFVHRTRYDGSVDIFIQRRNRWGKWRFISYYLSTMGGQTEELFTANTKEELLDKVIMDYYKLPVSHVSVVEHPTILMYSPKKLAA